MDPAFSFDPDSTIGAYQIGVLISYVLFGIYYGRFPNDSPQLKALVAFVWICEVGHTTCLGHSLYIYTISDYTRPERLPGAALKSFETSVLFSGIIGACVVLCKKLYIPLIWTMGFFRLPGCITIFLAGLGMTSLAGYIAQWEWLAASIWSVSTANDLTITGTLVLLLSQHHDRVQKQLPTSKPRFMSQVEHLGHRTSRFLARASPFSRGLAPGALGGAVGGRGQIDAKIAAVIAVFASAKHSPYPSRRRTNEWTSRHSQDHGWAEKALATSCQIWDPLTA
ncbi:hypothetical protein DFH08DRAFT_824537 [Mycena albidolilacea]|uniref:Uncharacterized protein n=1 Tax=Mycena albidolilacea TaxID=1033008 RepID=A0AAD7EA99_9AGAR|nr:hypothetical protein DFH08DRAFT_824537 [Mycena albidolilacea]